MFSRFHSFSRYPKVRQKVQKISERGAFNFKNAKGSVLAFGHGHSYGDVCLNDGGTVIDTSSLHRIISFDKKTGRIVCQGSVTLKQILEYIVPKGWFFPVVPSTEDVTVGGMIANDIHGTNHIQEGTLGIHTLSFDLLQSTGKVLRCTRKQHSDLFAATIAGLGLTGIILKAEFQCRKMPSPFLNVERLWFNSLKECLALLDSSAKKYEYVSCRIEPLLGRDFGKGSLIRANHVKTAKETQHLETVLRRPFEWLAMNFNIGLFLAVHYHRRRSTEYQTEYYKPFFFYLDNLLRLNAIGISRKWSQYQCVIPVACIPELLKHVLHSDAHLVSCIMKQFGNLQSPGLLSYPRPGYNIQLDFRYHRERTFELMHELDAIVLAHGGAVYPAKDARMSAKMFQRFYPQYRKLQTLKDPKFSSSFWRRVTAVQKKAASKKSK